MEKKNSGDRYTSSSGSSISNAVMLFLQDVELIRSNAHLFNPGDENLEVRIMVDALRNYIRYLLKVSLKLCIRAGESLLFKMS